MAIAALIQSFLDHLNQAVLVRDSRKRVIYLNPAATRLTGWPLKQVEGRRCQDVFCQNKAGCPIDCDAVDAAGANAPFECNMQTRAGTFHKMQGIASPLDLGTEAGTVVIFNVNPKATDPPAPLSRGIDQLLYRLSDPG